MAAQRFGEPGFSAPIQSDFKLKDRNRSALLLRLRIWSRSKGSCFWSEAVYYHVVEDTLEPNPVLPCRCGQHVRRTTYKLKRFKNDGHWEVKRSQVMHLARLPTRLTRLPAHPARPPTCPRSGGLRFRR